MPASPTTRKKRPRPAPASSRPVRNSTSSPCRPTKTASARWRGGGIAAIIPLSRTHSKDGLARRPEQTRRTPHPLRSVTPRSEQLRKEGGAAPRAEDVCDIAAPRQARGARHARSRPRTPHLESVGGVRVGGIVEV